MSILVSKDMPENVRAYLSSGGLVQDTPEWVYELAKLFILPTNPEYLKIEVGEEIVITSADGELELVRQAATIAGLLNIVCSLQNIEYRAATYYAIGY